MWGDTLADVAAESPADWGDKPAAPETNEWGDTEEAFHVAPTEPPLSRVGATELLNIPGQALGKTLFTHPPAPLQAVPQQAEVDPDKSLIGISPEMVGAPTRALNPRLGRVARPGGEPATVDAAPAGGVATTAALRALAGLGQFMTSPHGLVEMGAAATPLAPAVAAKWMLDMSEGAKESLVRAWDAYQKGDKQAMADNLAAAGLMAAGVGKGVHEAGKALLGKTALGEAGAPETPSTPVQQPERASSATPEAAAPLNLDDPEVKKAIEDSLIGEMTRNQVVKQPEPEVVPPEQAAPEPEPNAAPEAGKPLETNEDLQAQLAQELGQTSAPRAAKPRTPVEGASEYTLLDAVRDNGGLGGPNLNEAIAMMRDGRKPAQIAADYGGEYDGIANVLEQVWDSLQSKNRTEYTKLKAAYRKAGFGGGQKVIDQTLRGMLAARDEGSGVPNTPETPTDLIEAAWSHANGNNTSLSPTDLFWKGVDAPNSKIGLQRVNVGELSVGDTFRIRAPGVSHEELTVSHLDPDTGEIQVKDGPKLGVQTLPDGAEIWVESGTHKDASGSVLHEERPLFGRPESVEEQKARLVLEAKRKAEATRREAIAKQQAKPLIGKQGDIGQKELFGGGDLFSEEATEGAPMDVKLDSVANHLYRRTYDDLTPEQQRATREILADYEVRRRQQPSGESGREPVANRGDEATPTPEPEQQPSDLQRASPAAASAELSREKLASLQREWRVVRSYDGNSPQRQNFSAALGKLWSDLRRDALDTIVEALQVKGAALRDAATESLSKARSETGELNIKAVKNLPDADLEKVFNSTRIDNSLAEAKYKRNNLSTTVYPGAETQVMRAIGRLLEDKNALPEAERMAKEPTPEMEQPSIGSGIKAALEKNQGEAGSVRIPSAQEFRDKLGELPEHAKAVFRWSENQRKRVMDRITRSPERDIVSKFKDSADSRAKLTAEKASNVVLHELNRAFGVAAKDVRMARNALREFGLTMAVESHGDRNELGRMRYELTNSQAEGVNVLWKRRALRAIDFAQEHWDKLRPVADLYGRLTDAENAFENSKGVKTLYRKGGYVFHAQDVDETYGMPSTGNAQAQGGVPAPFRHIRDHNTYADAIANGVTPKTLNAIDLLQTRIALGQRLVNYGDWIDKLRNVTDRPTGLPLTADPEIRARVDGTQDITAPPGYSLVRFAGREIALSNGYTGLFGDLTNPSWTQGSGLRQAVMQGIGLSKHGMLLFDTYHLGRLAFWNAVTRLGLPRYERGFTLLDNTLPEMQNMVRRGELPEKWGKQLVEDKQILAHLVNEGYNVGNVGDNLHTDLLQKIPVLGGFNKWLFNQYQRGAMAEVGLIEFRRQSKMFAGETPDQIARRVAKDLNVRFGNLQSQGWIKSRTGQDLARLIFLAPQWNESLIKAEMGAVRQAGQSVKGLTQGRVQMGALARGVGTAMLGIFIGNQLINYATRGHPTWENPEEGAGAKISAWIPDAGGGPGFFLNPMSVPAEITHLLWKSTDRHQGDFGAALHDYFAGRMSAISKGLYTAFSGQTPLGEQTKGGWDRLKQAVSEASPLPISGSAIYRLGKQETTGTHQEKYPGQFQKQVMQSVGIKTEQAPDPGRRISTLAKRFEGTKGITEPMVHDIPLYGELTAAVKRQNMQDANEALDNILTMAKGNGEPHQLADVSKYYREWEHRPFTRNARLEAQFRQTLTPAQLQVYQKAKQDRAAVVQAVFKMLNARAKGPSTN